MERFELGNVESPLPERYISGLENIRQGTETQGILDGSIFHNLTERLAAISGGLRWRNALCGVQIRAPGALLWALALENIA